MYAGEYVRGEIDLVDAYLEPHDRVMELGGGLGVVSTFCAKRVGSENVVTYEGNPALENYIRETWAANGVSPKLVPALIGAREGEATLYIGKSTWAASMLPSPRKRPLRLPVRAFNEERRRFDPTFVVMDIEGAEYEVVQGADWGNVRALVMEAHPWMLGPEKTKAIDECLARAGFVLHRADEERFLYFTRKPPGTPTPWSFAAVADHFEDHIERSVPGYREGHTLICRLTDSFLRDDSRIYEVGCSTGALARILLAHHQARRGLRYCGIDTCERMVEIARRRGEADPRADYRVANASEFTPEPCSVAISYYTLQFVPREERAGIVRRIHGALEPRGAFLLFEKVRQADSELEKLAVDSLHRFKRDQGFGEEEIRAKDRALEGVLEPLSAAENEAMLRDAGFTSVVPVALWIPFQGWLAIR
jgi:tRNA (cmo5U34)-methyltransferase